MPKASRRTRPTACEIRALPSLAGIDPAHWDALCGHHPLSSHAFLQALHDTGCASARTGWQPVYLSAWRGRELVGALPLYLKAHSYGEYVFDWAWADAYRRYGRRYYPKLVSAIPFTPATGPRLMSPDPDVAAALLAGAQDLARRTGASSLHVLFPSESEAQQWQNAGLTLRHGVQFHWDNPGYRDFDDFLAALARDKRRKIRQERRRVQEAGIVFRRLEGRSIGAREWAYFFRCYCNTYREHGSTPYLSLAFFERLGREMPQHLLLVLGERADAPVCAALDVYDSTHLYGRYWGATEPVPCLHFEACYYQAIEFCIERRIARFEGGAQGAHKIARGFLPARTWSAHWIADPVFAEAIDAHLREERDALAHTLDELAERSPFRVVTPGG
jgi:predicted N-acyltransferase